MEGVDGGVGVEGVGGTKVTMLGGNGVEELRGASFERADWLG